MTRFYDSMVKHERDRLSSLTTSPSSVVFRQYHKEFKGKEHLLRVYRKTETINREKRDVFYFVVYEDPSQPIESSVIIFERTMDMKKVNNLLNKWESLP